MDTEPRPEPPEELASPRDVRILGAIMVCSGLALIYFMSGDMVVGGFVPAWWFGFLPLAMGIAGVLFPNTELFRARAGRLNALGKQFDGRAKK